MNFDLLISQPRQWVRDEKELHVKIITNLKLIYENRVHLERGYSSLFSFCVECLEMCPTTAQRRIDAMRFSEKVPDLGEKISSGEISLNRISQISSFLRLDKKEVGRDFKAVEVRELVETVSECKTDFDAKRLLAQRSQIETPKKPDQTVVTRGGGVRLDFEIDDETLQLLEQVKNLQAHKGKQPIGEILKDMLKEYLKHHHPNFKGAAKKEIKIQNEFVMAEKVAAQHGSKNKHATYLRLFAIRSGAGIKAFVHTKTQKLKSDAFQGSDCIWITNIPKLWVVRTLLTILGCFVRIIIGLGISAQETRIC